MVVKSGAVKVVIIIGSLLFVMSIGISLLLLFSNLLLSDNGFETSKISSPAATTKVLGKQQYSGDFFEINFGSNWSVSSKSSKDSIVIENKNGPILKQYLALSKNNLHLSSIYDRLAVVDLAENRLVIQELSDECIGQKIATNSYKYDNFVYNCKGDNNGTNIAIIDSRQSDGAVIGANGQKYYLNFRDVNYSLSIDDFQDIINELTFKYANN